MQFSRISLLMQINNINAIHELLAFLQCTAVCVLDENDNLRDKKIHNKISKLIKICG